MILTMSEIAKLTGISRSVAHSWVTRSFIPSRVVLNHSNGKTRTYNIESFVVMGTAHFLINTLHVEGSTLRRLMKEALQAYRNPDKTPILLIAYENQEGPFIVLNEEPKGVVKNYYVWDLWEMVKAINKKVRLGEKPLELPFPKPWSSPVEKK